MSGGDRAFLAGWERLTEKQAEVLVARSQGYDCCQIAAQRDITWSSVMNHSQDALAKLPANGGAARARLLWVSYMIGRLGLGG